ncbi:hypothetical protein [Xylocopilactobacillus apicola]|uniref:Transposase n=1 Tax=Xylocopilactobacillus apicola TaxID=2932184 RepID=A0AAU9D833_9LACO|nr:hypothetical protein [Xylocopilactobacillus apicola]BDR59713.1 hypothetical protein XA3_21540 [Xylocopilactobacillus apicola]
MRVVYPINVVFLTIFLDFNDILNPEFTNNVLPYSYRTFCRDYTAYAKRYKATLRIRHKPAETMEVDWPGLALHLIDQENGVILDAHLFVATLPCSGYAYCEAFLSRNEEA